MGHMVGKDLYRKLGKKIDSLSARTPFNDTFYAILKELYTSDEAELAIKMPYGLVDFEQILQTTKYEPTRLKKLLDSLCSKGLVMDIYLMGGYRYTLSPLVIGIFEFTMMRTRGELNTKELAKLFHSYMQGDNAFYKANFGKNQKYSPLRAMPWQETIDDSDYVEILDYEKASAIIDGQDKFAIGLCSCRHEKMHVGEKKCDVPLETCSTMGPATDYVIRHGFAKEVSKTEMLENLARSKEMGLVICADNVKKNVSFLCHCCGCCCNVLLGISRFGYPNILVTSNYIAACDKDICTECGNCIEACPINAISESDNASPAIDESVCVGCGVCALSCPSEALKLTGRKQRVHHPEDTFERIILQSLDQGNLQTLLFANPQSVSHGLLRGFVGAFLRLPPVKKALMSDTLRSSFLGTLRK